MTQPGRSLLLPAAVLSLLFSGCAKQSAPTDDEAADLATRDGASAADQATAPSRTALSGKLTRTARPKNGGKGDLYVAVFEGNPVVEMKSARLLGRQLIPAVDFSDDKTVVMYRVEGILPAQRETQVLAFLDDNHTVDQKNLGPDAGDPVTLDGIGGIKVTLKPDAENVADLVLNALIPSF